MKDQRNYEKRSHTLCKGGKTHVRRKIFTDNFILRIDSYLHNILITKKKNVFIKINNDNNIPFMKWSDASALFTGSAVAQW